MNAHIILFYQFTKLKDPRAFADEHQAYCEKEKLLGKVLVSEEGINGSLSGTKQKMDRYKEFLRSQPGFKDVRFKDEVSTFHPFKRMIVRVKNEIIRMDKDVDMAKTAPFITPQELLDLYNSDEEFYVLDTRNNYESDVGKFKNAITPNIDTFRDFPKVLESLQDKKDKKIITYCTGGIRCEKATAYMNEQGFTNVYQLKDGIINFCQELPNTVWEGKCFVFDRRLLSSVDPNSNIISKCAHCNKKCDRYQNCKNVSCDRFIVLCEQCSSKLGSCCSEKCAKEYEQHLKEKAITRQGHKQNEVASF